MREKERKHDAFARLREWLENGDQALDREMEESLDDEAAPQKPAADDRDNTITARKRSAIPVKAGRAKKRQNIRKSGGAYADAWWYRLAASRNDSLLCDSYHGRNRRSEYCDRDHPGLSGI